MRQGLAHVSESMSQSEINSAETSKFAKLGKEKIDESAREMELISSTVGATVMQIKQLEDRTKEIGSIISVIGSISDQTNLLALNAAIEAARAGESGRGFAVVADEVRNLSLRTGEATQQIEKMINEVQNETAASVMAMEKTQPLVENGRALTIETIDLLLNIEKQANSSLLNVQEVANATNQQVEFIEKISISMQDINTMSTESIAALQTNNEITQSLDVLSQELKTTVGYFKLGWGHRNDVLEESMCCARGAVALLTMRYAYRNPLRFLIRRPCPSRLTLMVKTRSRRGFHLNDIHVINPAWAFDARGDLSWWTK